MYVRVEGATWLRNCRLQEEEEACMLLWSCSILQKSLQCFTNGMAGRDRAMHTARHCTSIARVQNVKNALVLEIVGTRNEVQQLI